MVKTRHAIEQLYHRWPQWTENELNKKINKKIGWQQANGETHIYLGTGLDMYTSDKESKIRPYYKKRHLFAVISHFGEPSAKLITVVFHTTTAMLARASAAKQVWNDELEPEIVNNKEIKKFTVEEQTWYMDTTDIFSVRKERFLETNNFKIKINALH